MAPLLPLPMAALVSLTITFKIEKSLHYINAVVGQALESCATRCPWSSKPIISALWSQKLCSWRDYIIFDCICSPIARDMDTIAQLIRSCFASFLGLPGPNHLTPHCSINAILGGAVTDKGYHLRMAPVYVYLRTCRTFSDVRFISNIILCLVINWAQKMAAGCTSHAPANFKSGKSSLTAAVAGVQDAASLGASLLCITGGLRLVQVLYEETLPEVLILTSMGFIFIPNLESCCSGQPDLAAKLIHCYGRLYHCDESWLVRFLMIHVLAKMIEERNTATVF